MKWLNFYRIRLVVVVFLVASVTRVGRADFVICNPMPVEEAINDEDTTNVQGCSFLHNGLKLYFSASRDPQYADAREIWVSERESLDAPWGEAVNLGPNVNRPGRMETYPTISPDDLELYFWYSNPWQPMRSTRASTDEPWGPATEFTGYFPEDFSPDGLTIYFDSDRPGGYGGWDIWMVTREKVDAPWSEPVNLGPNVNKEGDQGFGSISNDGLVLFFGDGGIHMCVRTSTDDDWGPAVRLDSTVNGASFQGSPEISPDGSVLYFDSGPRSGYPELFWQVSLEPIVDFNGDGIVDIDDLVIMIENWDINKSLCDIGPMPWGDGIVDRADLEVLMECYNQVIDAEAYYKLDETEGTVAYDCSGYYCDANVIGDPNWQPEGGMIDGALEFDGINDYISTPFILNPLDGPFSIFAWIKGGAPGQVILSQADSTNLLCADSLDGCLMTVWSGRVAQPLLSQTVITDGNWHRVGFTWDGEYRILYVDDVIVAEDTQTSVPSSEGGLFIGAGNELEPGTFWSGLIDDVRIYNRVITP